MDNIDIAQEIFETYDFGDLECVAADGWISDTSNEIRRIIYIENENPEEASLRASLTVSFPADDPELIYFDVLWMDSGDIIAEETFNLSDYRDDNSHKIS